MFLSLIADATLCSNDSSNIRESNVIDSIDRSSFEVEKPDGDFV